MRADTTVNTVTHCHYSSQSPDGFYKCCLINSVNSIICMVGVLGSYREH